MNYSSKIQDLLFIVEKANDLNLKVSLTKIESKFKEIFKCRITDVPKLEMNGLYLPFTSYSKKEFENNNKDGINQLKEFLQKELVNSKDSSYNPSRN